MIVATNAEQITPLREGQTVPQGSLTTMDGQTTTLQAVLQDQAAVLIFYRGSW